MSTRAAVVEQHPVAGRVVVRCLGQAAVHVNGRRIDVSRPNKANGLFHYLLAHRSRPVPRNVLVDELWPDPNALAAHSSLKVAVHAVRDMLAQMGEQADMTLRTHPNSYHLSARDIWVDVEAFEWHVDEGARLDTLGQVPEATAHFARATALYGGDFLEASLADWVVLRREALKDQYMFVLERLAEVALSDADYRSCVLHCQKLLRLEPCREATYRLLLKALARLGHRARVQRWYALCERTLRTQLDVAPEPETQRIYRHALVTSGLFG